MPRKGKEKKKKKKERRKKLAEATCPGKEKKNGRGNMPRKGKEKKNLQRQCASIHGHFRQLSNLIFSLKFSLHFGEKTFWWAQGEDTQAPSFIFLPPYPIKHTPKSFSSHFLLKVFHPLYFTSKQTRPKNSIKIFLKLFINQYSKNTH